MPSTTRAISVSSGGADSFLTTVNAGESPCTSRSARSVSPSRAKAVSRMCSMSPVVDFALATVKSQATTRFPRGMSARLSALNTRRIDFRRRSIDFERVSLPSRMTRKANEGLMRLPDVVRRLRRATT